MISTLLFIAASQSTHLKGRALLDDVSHRAFNYFWEQSPNTLTLDRAPNYPGAPKKPDNDNPASIAAVGYALCACAVGAHNHWVPQKIALQRAIKTARTVYEKAPSKKGWFYHWINPKVFQIMWGSEVSTIDSSLYLNGLLMAEGYFKDPELTRIANKTYERIDWNYFLTDGGRQPKREFFSMGYHDKDGFINATWHDFNELIHLEILAYTLWDKMPLASWNNWERNPVEYKGFHFLRGGSLFLHQMSAGFYDFRNRRDRLGYDYWVDGRNATLAQIAYCNENPKHQGGYGGDIWGLSACDIPNGYTANGAPVDVEDTGTLAPAAAAASALFTPNESIRAAEAFVTKYPESYGTYGFTTGIHPGKNWRSDFALGIDLGQVMLNIENFKDNSPHKWVMSQPRVEKAFNKIGLRVTHEGPTDSRKLYQRN
jgi:hypothetical protein